MPFQEAKNQWMDRHAKVYRTLKAYKNLKKYKNLKERKRSLKNFLPFSPTNGSIFSEKASFLTSFKDWTKAGVALETLLVLPLFFLGLVTVISFMDIYRLETEHLFSLCEAAKKAGMYAYLPDGDGPEEIILPDVYAYQPISGLLPLPKVWLYTSVKVHAWTGAGEGTFEGNEETEPMVYVAENGRVFHRSQGCTYLDLSVDQVAAGALSSLRNAYGERYTACASCSRNQEPAGSVYITEKGSHYHNLETCSGLKRTVRLVKESEAAGHACSRCG